MKAKAVRRAVIEELKKFLVVGVLVVPLTWWFIIHAWPQHVDGVSHKIDCLVGGK